MYCMRCGNEVEGKFCSRCGEPIKNNNLSVANGAAKLDYGATATLVGKLKTNRRLWKYLLFTPLTFGIYSIIFFSSISQDINGIASKYDNIKTMHYCLLFFLIAPITLEIAYIVWFHKISGRIGRELKRRGIEYSFGKGTFWLCRILGMFIIIGPFIYLHKLSRAMNLLSEDYNNEQLI